MSQNQKSVFDSLDRKLRKDLVIGGYIACGMIISALFGWGLYNQSQWRNCTDHFTDYAIKLQQRTEERYEHDKKYNDSLRIQVQAELRKARDAKEELERQLSEIKNAHK